MSTSGSDALANCEVTTGYFVKTANAADVTKVVIAKAEKNQYAEDGTSVTFETAVAAECSQETVPVYYRCSDETYSFAASYQLADRFFDVGYYPTYPEGYA